MAHGAGQLAARTRQRVIEAAASLSYRQHGRTVTAPGVARVTYDIILPAGPNAYVAALQNNIARVSERTPGLKTRFHTVEGFNPDRLAHVVRGLVEHCDGIALIGLDHPVVRDAIRDAKAVGMRVILLASDIANVPRDAFVGTDNRAAGRLAGQLLGRLIRKQGPIKIALVAGSRDYRAHEEREAGCTALLRQDHPDVLVLPPIEVRDDHRIAAEATARLLAEHPDLAGIYSIGAGNRGVAQALTESGLAGSVVTIVHELTPWSRGRLVDGCFDVVIDQRPDLQADLAIQLMNSEHPPRDSTQLIRFSVYFRENLP